MPGEVLRSSYAVLREFHLDAVPVLTEWGSGPLPLAFAGARQHDKLSMDKVTRLSYFADRIGTSLYDARYWRTFDTTTDAGTRRWLLELLLVDAWLSSDVRCIFVAHCDVVAGPVSSVASAVRDTAPILADLFEASTGVRPKDNESGGDRVFSVCFSLIDERAARPLPDDYSTWETKEQVAWCTACKWPGTTSSLPSRREIEDLRSQGCVLNPLRRLSMVVHHNGAGIVATTSNAATNVFPHWTAGEASPGKGNNEYAELQVHTLFVDCFIVGLLQRAGLNGIADRFSLMANHRPRVHEMMDLERAFAEFKSAIWWHQVTEESTANDLLRAFQTQYRLDDMLAEVGRDIAHYSGQIQTLSNARGTAAVTVLTIVIVPLTVLCYLVTSLLPASASGVQKTLAFLGTVPASLFVGLGVAALIPGYVSFLRDVFFAGDRRSGSASKQRTSLKQRGGGRSPSL